MVAVGGREARAEGGPANIVSDPAAAEAALRLTLEDALNQLSLGFDALPGARVVAGLAGGRLGGAADAFATRLPFLALVVDDSVTALQGALGDDHGTLVNLGTGSFFIRRDGRGLTHHGGWGYVLGDEGSAAWLGRLALTMLTEIEDGRRAEFAEDPLRKVLLEASPPHPVLFAADSGAENFASLAPLIFNRDTPMAVALQRHVEGAVRSGLAAIKHPGGTPWVLTGGLGAALADRLDGQLTAGLRPPAGSALDGALAMARALP